MRRFLAWPLCARARPCPDLSPPPARAVWQTQYPPDSQPTEITLSQFLSIQEKGVSAWSFEPDYESNPAIIVESRTEITFLADGYGMAPEAVSYTHLTLPTIYSV